MPNVNSMLIKEAFIDPIRFALLLDDTFPIYPNMGETQNSAQLNIELANDLFSLCRSRGWLCDIDNGVEVAENFEETKHLHQSDLLVLDFHLDPSQPSDPTKALAILQQLQRSDHFNLVIVYTAAEDMGNVIREIGFALGAGRSSKDFANSVRETVEDLDQSIDQVSAEINVSMLENSLFKENLGATQQGVRRALTTAGVDQRMQSDVIYYLCAKHYESRSHEKIISKRFSGEKVQASVGNVEGPHWVTSRNVFCAVINKSDRPDVLPDRLLAALESWAPTPLHVMMVHARAALERAGSAADRSVLDTPRKQAGWILRILLSESDSVQKYQIRQLYGRMFEQLTESIKPAVLDFSEKVIATLLPNDSAVKRARELAGAGPELTDIDIYHALNEHVSSDKCADGPMTTGVVFSSGIDGNIQYWICLTPACDLIPGQQMLGWNVDIHPWKAITAARLVVTAMKDGVATVMKTATYGRHIYLHLNNRAVALEVTSQDSRQMNIETILIANEGIISDAAFSGQTLSCIDNSLQLKSVEFKALAVLRGDYANKFLAESGYQRARIGVDYFNYVDSN